MTMITEDDDGHDGFCCKMYFFWSTLSQLKGTQLYSRKWSEEDVDVDWD